MDSTVREKPTTSDSGGDTKFKLCGDSCREKLLKWSKDCSNLFKCCFNFSKKSKSGDDQDEEDPGDRTNTGRPTRDAVELDDFTELDEHQQSETASGHPPAKSKAKPQRTPKEPYTPQLHKYNVHNLRDFPPEPFKSATYEGAYTEILKWVRPLKYNVGLHTVFLDYTTPPRTNDKLQRLSTCLQEYENALKANKEPPDHHDIASITNELSPDPGVKMDEIKSLIILSEAFMEFPQHIVKRAIDLPHVKRQTLVDLVRKTPYGVSRHVYMDEGPFNDPDLYPIMSRMGFNIPSHQPRLEYTAQDDNDDMLAAGFFLLLGTEKEE